MIEVHVLASGSDGNCTVIECDGEAIMIDAGISCKRILSLMEQEGVDKDVVKAILLTHATFSQLSLGNVDFVPFDSAEPFDVAGFHVTPLPTSHNAIEPNAFLTQRDDRSVLLATDTGKLTFQIEAALRTADIAVIESNYDNKMLADGPYPVALKRLIGSERGHLSNVDCANAIRRTMSDSGRQLFLAHLSKTNNIPDLARDTVSEITGIKRLNIDCLEFPGDTRTLKA